jgi:acetyl esterase
VFVHGGAWQRGDKNLMFSLHANVGHACARAGVVGVVINYRLFPEVCLVG